MGRPSTALLACLALVLASLVVPRVTLAATPDAGTISSATPSVQWTGTFIASNPIDCGVAEATCDHFTLTVVAPSQPYVVKIFVVAAQFDVDDIDLHLRDANGKEIAASATSSSREEIVYAGLPSGTYTVVVQPFLVVPPSRYSAAASIEITTAKDSPNAFRSTAVGPGFAGVPLNAPTSFAGQTLEVSWNAIGRRGGEPTIGVDKQNRAYFVAADFDSKASVPGVARLARSLVLRSIDKGKTWTAVSPELPLIDTTTEPPATLDPYIHVDPVTGRVFSADLYVGCTYLTWTDDGGATWDRDPVACGDPVNDHHSIVTGPPPIGLSTVGYPRAMYYCFNRVADSSCTRSLDGGRTFEKAGEPAFTGYDVNGGICGGLNGQIVTDSKGRVFMGKGHCGKPMVAVTEDGGLTWSRSTIADHIVMAYHEISLAVDAADNVYATWSDATWILPFLSVSRDHGKTWSTPVMIAPPQVHEANFPTVVAGAAGRVAVLFPGTRSLDRADDTRPWDLYVLMSIDALGATPTFTWTTANPQNDPVHRGDCGPDRCQSANGGNMLDFLDIQLSPADGAFWGTASDTCVGACVTDPTARGISPGEGYAIRQTKGPSLTK